MAHNLEEKNGQVSFVSNGQKAWHNLGTIVDGAMTTKEVIELANLDYEVLKTHLVAEHELDGVKHYMDVPNRIATYRNDTKEVLGIVSDRYEIVQNIDAFSFFDAIIDEGEAIFETAGVLGRGEKIFVTAKLPDDLMVGGEKCEEYILLTNSHDGSSSIIAGFTSVRVVCQNTLNFALSNVKNKYAVQHKLGAKDRLSEAYRIMDISSKYTQEAYEHFNRMVDVKLDDGQFRDYIINTMKPHITKDEDSTRFKNLTDRIFNFAKTHPTQTTDETNGTLWGAYNSISGYYNYLKKYPSAEAKFKNTMFGADNSRIEKAFNNALDLIQPYAVSSYQN
jgi:phage/plasmid-like protein (TIGR03299 family)